MVHIYKGQLSLEKPRFIKASRLKQELERITRNNKTEIAKLEDISSTQLKLRSNNQYGALKFGENNR